MKLVALLLSASATPSLAALGHLKATAAAAQAMKDGGNAIGSSTDLADMGDNSRYVRPDPPDWRSHYDDYVRYVDPDGMGFVIQLHSEGTRHTERGEDYGFMCRGKKCEEGDWLVTNHVRACVRSNDDVRMGFGYARAMCGQYHTCICRSHPFLSHFCLPITLRMPIDQQQRGKVPLRVHSPSLAYGCWADQSQDERSLFRSRR